MDFLLNPQIILEGFAFFMREYWLLDEFMLNGPMVGLLWIFEAIAIIGLVWWSAEAYAGQKDNIYCEQCGRWTENESYSPLLVGKSLDQITRRLNHSGDLNEIFSLTTTSDPQVNQEYLVLKIDSCPGCDELHVLDVDKRRYRLDDDDDDDDDLTHGTVRAVENLLLDKRTAGSLRSSFSFSESEP